MEHTELERLREENELLRSKILELKNQTVTGKKPMNRGCMIALVSLVVAFGTIFIISILAAISLPLYAEFTKKAEFNEECIKLYDLAFHINTSYQNGEGFPYDLNTIEDFEKYYGITFNGEVRNFEYSHEVESATFIFYYIDGKLRDKNITLHIECLNLQCEPTLECSDPTLRPPANPH